MSQAIDTDLFEPKTYWKNLNLACWNAENFSSQRAELGNFDIARLSVTH